MRMKKIIFLPLLALLLSGCKKPLPSEDPSSSLPPSSAVIEAESITISSAGNVSELEVDATLALTAKVLPEGASQEVLWESTDTNKAVVSDNGLVTGKAIGNVFIIAKAKAKTAVSKQFALTIIPKESQVPDPESIMISAPDSATTLEVNKTLQLSSFVLPTEANQSVIW
ncbi:MAG: Ig-like domain-containing protein, partial [Spirochaetota bacterium]